MTKCGRLLAAALALSLGAAACSGSTDTASGGSDEPTSTAEPAASEAPTTDDTTPEEVDPFTLEVVSFYDQGSPDYELTRRFADQYEADHPGVTVDLVFGGGADTPRIEARWREGNPPEVNTGQFFDAMAANASFLESGQAQSPYYDEGLVHQLDDAMGEIPAGYDAPWGELVYPAVRPYVESVDGGVYAAPRAVTTIQMYYNQAIFDELGLDAPSTVEELMEAAAAIKESGTAPFAVTGTFPYYLQMWLDYLLLRQAGPEQMPAAIAGDIAFDEIDGVQQAAETLTTMISEGYFQQGFEAIDFTAAQLSFFQGDAAMILMGSWLKREMADSIPEGFELGTFAFPAVEGGVNGDYVFGSPEIETVSSQSEHPDAGAEWLRFMASKDVQQARVEELGYISPYQGAPVAEEFEDIARRLESEDAFVFMYWNLLGLNEDVRLAYQEPVTRAFLEGTSADDLVSTISQRLADATSGS